MLTQDKLDKYIEELNLVCNKAQYPVYIENLLSFLQKDCEELLEVYKDVCYDYREYAERKTD